jgi:hypothetical protein
MASTPKLKIDRLALLQFYDVVVPDENKGHASAINGIAGEELGAGLLKHYFENSENSKATIRSEKCNTGQNIGHRLDSWIEVDRSEGKILYQVEIKNWSAHSYKGKNLPLNSTESYLKERRLEAWGQHWDAKTNTLYEGTRKVLTKMKAPIECIVEPLLCMWIELHPEGLNEPFFRIELDSKHAFKHLNVFSISSYLKSMNNPFIEIEMPMTLKRYGLLNSLFGCAT